MNGVRSKRAWCNYCGNVWRKGENVGWFEKEGGCQVPNAGCQVCCLSPVVPGSSK